MAALLARSGLSVVVLEKRQPGDEKTCAGGVLQRALVHVSDCLPFPTEDNGISQLLLTCRGQDLIDRETKTPVFATVLRSDFDAHLQHHAQLAGAKTLFGTTVSQVDESAQGVRVVAGDLEIEATVVVGADGADSIVARQSGLAGTRLEPAVTMRVSSSMLHRFRHCAAIDWDTPPGGYSWIFPKSDHLSVGAGGPRADKSLLLKGAQEHLRRHFGDDYSILDTRSAFLPVFAPNMRRSTSRALLVGDAATLVDPFTREGISWTLWSAHVASEAVVGFVRGQNDLGVYDCLLERELLPELRAAASVAEWFYADAKSAQSRLRSSHTWEQFCGLLDGSVSHRQLRRKLFPLRVLSWIRSLRAGLR